MPVLLLLGLAPVATLATEAPGAGSIGVSPASVAAGANLRQVTFTYTAPRSGKVSGLVSVGIPSGWTAPQAIDATGPGYVTVVRNTCQKAALTSLTAETDGATSALASITCSRHKSFSFVYASVTAPAKADTYGFPAAARFGGSADFVSFVPEPTITVTPGAAADIALALAPEALPADGAATAVATATVTDAGGNGVPNESVTFDTSGDATFGSVADQGDGTYTVTITASTTAGDEMISAHDEVLTAAATLHETAVAPTTAPIQWAELIWPASATVGVGEPVSVYGQVYVPGYTDAPGAMAGMVGQVGYGPPGTDPANDPGWTWIAGTYNTDVGNNDEYVAPLASSTAGSFDYVYRFSTDGGSTWFHADLGGPIGGGNGGVPLQPGQLHVVAPTLSIDVAAGTRFDPPTTWGVVQDGVFVGDSLAYGDAPVTVRATDGAGNLETGFTGTVDLSSMCALAVQGGPSYTFTNADAGSHVFEVAFGDTSAFGTPGASDPSQLGPRDCTLIAHDGTTGFADGTATASVGGGEYCDARDNNGNGAIDELYPQLGSTVVVGGQPKVWVCGPDQVSVVPSG